MRNIDRHPGRVNSQSEADCLGRPPTPRGLIVMSLTAGRKRVPCDDHFCNYAREQRGLSSSRALAAIGMTNGAICFWESL